MDNDLLHCAVYWKWLDKQIQNKPDPVKTIMRRTMNTATTIISTIADVPFEKLTASLYFFCQDIKIKGFTRLYESQLELAGANPEKFAKGLHKFYNETTVYIKKENLYQQFFDFLALTMRARSMRLTVPEDDLVMNCYQSLLLQNAEYLKPNKFDFSVVICGQSTAGELLVVDDIYPTLDKPAYEIERSIRDGKYKTNKEMIADIEPIYSKYGYKDVYNINEISTLSAVDRIASNQRLAMLPFINEYTFDLLPTTPFSTFAAPFAFLRTSLSADTLVNQLHKRKRTLPSNGVTFIFNDEKMLIRKVLLKEILYDESIHMLFKMETMEGDLCGYYDTKDGFLYHIFNETKGTPLFHNIKCLLLYLYGCAVLQDGEIMQQKLSDVFWYSISERDGIQHLEINMKMYGHGGKLKNVYEKTTLVGRSRNSELYEGELRPIQGFIRRVPEGQTPSEEARARAEALGFDLAINETYVQPFIKNVLHLKLVK